MRAGFDLGHIAPGYTYVLQQGLLGVMAEARCCRAGRTRRPSNGQLAFLQAVETACRGAITAAGRYARLAERMAHGCPEHAGRLRQVADACRWVPAHPARTFHEALQTIWFLHEWVEMEGEAVRSMGHLDRMLFPYYQADLDAGRLTREQAKEMLKFLWVRNFARTQGCAISGKNFLFGGQDRNGDPVENDLTYLALDAYEELDLPDPKFSVRFCPGTSPRLYERVADMIRRNKGSFVLMNDTPAVAALAKRGKELADAREYLPIGCYEPAVDGREAACTMNVIVSLPKALELALHDGRDPRTGAQCGPRTGDARTFRRFEELWAAYAAQVAYVVGRAAENVRTHEGVWPTVNPSPFLAGTVADCLARGKDIGEGGARYNAVGCVGVGLANVADSLLALRQAVFEEGRWTLEEVLQALAEDFARQEAMRLHLLNRVPKWGNGHPEADALARRVADHFCSRVHEQRCARGGPFQAALFSFDFQWSYGKLTGALPDGRHAFQPLAPGVGAAPGRDRQGVTGLLGSAAGLDFTETPNGSVLDVTLHPSVVQGEEGLAALVGLIRGFFAEGGYALQMNVTDLETLRDAQRHPEQYAGLQIRVTGYSAYFTKLSKYEQDQFLAVNAHR